MDANTRTMGKAAGQALRLVCIAASLAFVLLATVTFSAPAAHASTYCSSTITVNSYSWTARDHETTGSNNVRLTIRFQELQDAASGAYCGQSRSQFSLTCQAPSGTSCVYMNLQTWMIDGGTGQYGYQSWWFASLASGATNTLNGQWITLDNPDFWQAEGYYGGTTYQQCTIWDTGSAFCTGH